MEPKKRITNLKQLHKDIINVTTTELLNLGMAAGITFIMPNNLITNIITEPYLSIFAYFMIFNAVTLFGELQKIRKEEKQHYF